MSEQEATQQNATQPLIQERCLCREIVNQLREAFGVSPKVQEHFNNSRIEFLKGIRAVIDSRSSTAASSTCPTPASAAPRSPSSSPSDTLEMVCPH
jgi:hypothetical protein